MRLVIGGYAQGKLDYVRSRYCPQGERVLEGCVLDSEILRQKYKNKVVVVNHFHRWVRKCLMDGGCPEDEVSAFLGKCQGQCADCIIISDEVGNGIVPMDAFEREYRERLGRILIQLAERAEGVERVLCGIGQKIK